MANVEALSANSRLAEPLNYARFFVDQGAVLDAMSCCRAGVAAARLDGVDDDPDEPRGSVVADAHKCWAQAHVSRAESFIATRRTVATCTEKDAH